MSTWLGFLLCLIGLILLGWHLTYTAARLDRLHVRVEGSLASLDAQLVRRAEVALELGQGELFDPASAFLLVSTSTASLELAESAAVIDEVQQIGIPAERADVESDLTAALVAVCAEWNSHGPGEVELRQRLSDACSRVQLARRFHNDAVRDVGRVRTKLLVRAFHLAGHTALPVPVVFDDEVAALSPGSGW